MKILATIFRLLCALLVLLAVATYLDGSLQVSITEYLGAFTPEHIQSMLCTQFWIACAAGGLLLLALIRALKLTWNLAYSLATIVFFLEAAFMILGPELAMPSAARGLGWEQMLRDLYLAYPVPALMIPALCILGCFCSSAPVRIALTSLICCALCYGCAELFQYLTQQWQAMPEPFMPQALELVQTMPWIVAAVPAAFFLQYCLFMALFETFIPRKKKFAKPEEVKEETAVPGADASKAADKKPENTPKVQKPVAAGQGTPVVVVKRPVVHKKSPISSAPAETRASDAPVDDKAPAPKVEEKTEAATEQAPKTAETPAVPEEPREETPSSDTPAADTPKPEEEAKAAADETPTKPAIPSVPMPPHAAS